MFLFLVIAVFSTISIAGASSNFVQINGTEFYLNGKVFYFAGTNSYYLWYGNWVCSGYDTHQGCSKEVLDDAVKMNLSVIRVWGFSDGGNYWGTLQTNAGVYNEADFRRYDRMIKEVSDRNLKLIIPLVNYWNDYGGMNQYLSWCNDSGTDRFYLGTCEKNLYKKYIAYFLNRTNTVTGIKYKDDPTIMAWELANEPRAVSNDALNQWIEEISNYLKSIDNSHLVSVGEEGFYGQDGNDFIADHNHPSIDFAGFHFYADKWGMSEEQASDYMKQHIEDSHKILKKPVIIGEYGMPASNRDSYFQKYFETAENEKLNGDLLWMIKDLNYPDWDSYGVNYPEYSSTDSLIIKHANNMKNMTALNQIPGDGCPLLNDMAILSGTTILCNKTYNISNYIRLNDNAVLDCNGSILQGNQSISQIDLGANSTIKNCIIKDFANGVYGYHDYYVKIINNVFDNCTTAFATHDVQYSNFINNTVKNCNKGVSIWWYTNYNLFENNRFINNTWMAIYFDWHGDNNTFKSNYFYNNPICAYHQNEWYGTIYNNTFIDNVLDKNNMGFYTMASQNMRFINNSIKNSERALQLQATASLEISNNLIENSTFGIYIISSENNSINNNKIDNADYPIRIDNSVNNTIYENSIKNSRGGVYLIGSSKSIIWHNNFINNIGPASESSGSDNVWDFNNQGNYWSNFDENSEGCSDSNKDGKCDSPYVFTSNQDNYPFTEETGWIVPKISVNPAIKITQKGQEFVVDININTTREIYALSFDLVYNFSVLNVTKVNEGSFLKSDGANTYPIVNLQNGKITFANTRIGVNYGINGIGALASITFKAKEWGNSSLILQNISVSDAGIKQMSSIAENGFVNVIKLIGDTNYDCKVDIFDLAMVGVCYNGKAEGSCANADVFTDGKIDIFDLAMVGKAYGSVC